jgi:hypothetical protein
MSINTDLNGRKYFKEFEASISKHEDYKELTKIIYPTLDNWRFKNRRFDNYRKMLRKFSIILNRIYKDRFVDGFQDSHFAEEEKLILISIFKFIQRILVFSPNHIDLYDKSLWLKYALCFDIEVSIQAFKIIALNDRTDIFIKQNDAYVEILLKMINIPNLTLRRIDYPKDVMHNNLDNLTEDTDIIQLFKVNRTKYNISDLYLEINKRICEKDINILILRRVYALISLSSNIGNKDFFNVLVDEFSKNEIVVIKNGISKIISKDFPLLCISVFDELRFCLDTFILYHLTLVYDYEIIGGFLELNDNQGYFYKSLDLAESNRFENIMIYSILEELLINNESDFNYNIKLALECNNPDLEFRYLCVVYNYVKKDDLFFEKNLDLEYFKDFIDHFDTYLIEKDLFVLKLTFKIINEIYQQGNSYFGPFEDSQYLKKCLNIINDKNELYFYHCINSITFFMNNDPLSIKKILDQGLVKIFEEFIWNEEVLKSLVNLFDAISLDKDTRNDFIKSNKLSSFLSAVFYSEDAYLLDSISDFNVHLSILLMHHPEYQSGLNEFIKKTFEYMAFLPKKLRGENTSINMSNFFRFVSTLKLDINIFFSDCEKEMLFLLDLIYINSSGNDKIWMSSFFEMFKCESIIILDRIIIMKYFVLKLGSIIFKIIDTEYGQSKEIIDKKLYESLEKYLYFICHIFSDGCLIPEDENYIFKVSFYLIMNILPNLLKYNIYTETNNKTLDDLIKYRNELINSESSILLLIYLEVEFLLGIILFKEDGYESTSWFKYFLNILYQIEYTSHDSEPKRLKTYEGDYNNSREYCEIKIRFLLNNTINNDKAINEIDMMDSYAVVNDLSEGLVQKNIKFFLRIIEKNIYKFNFLDTRYFLDWISKNDILNNESLWSKNSLSSLLCELNLISPEFDEEDTRIKIFDFLIANSQNKDIFKNINSLIYRDHKFSLEEKSRILDYFINNYKKGVLINYSQVFDDAKFVRKMLYMKDYKMIYKNDYNGNIDVVLYIVNHEFSISKDFVDLSIYVLKKLSFNHFRANVEKIKMLFSNINILYDQEKYLKLDIDYFMKNLSLLLKSKEIRKRAKIIYIISFLKYCKYRLIALKMSFYARILNFTEKMISNKNKEDTNMLIKSVFHHLLIELSNSYNIRETHICSYNKFIDSHYLLGYRDIDALKDKFKGFLQDLKSESKLKEEKKLIEITEIQRKLFLKCMKRSLKNIYLINIINEILINDERYEEFICEKYIKSIIKKYVLPVIFSEKITAEADYFIAIDFLAYCIRSGANRLFNMVYEIIVQKILESEDFKIYNLVIILYTSLDFVKIIYHSKERQINDDVSVLLSEKFMSLGISDKIFLILSIHKETDFSLPENIENQLIKNSYDRSSIIAWNQIMESNKISFIYTFLSTIYSKYYNDLLIENEESEEDFWENESNDSDSYFDEHEEVMPGADNITIIDSSSEYNDEDSYSETYKKEKPKTFYNLFSTLYISEIEFEIVEKNCVYYFVSMLSKKFEKEFEIDNIYEYIKIKKDDLDKVEFLVDSEESNIEDNQNDEIEEDLEFSDESSIGEENGIKPGKTFEEINNMDEEALIRFIDEWYEERKMNSVNYEPIDKTFFDQLSELCKQLFAEHERKLKDDYFQYAPSCESSQSSENEEKEVPEDIIMYTDIEIFKNFLRSYLTSNYTYQTSLNEFIEVASFNLEFKTQIISIVMDTFLGYNIDESVENIKKCLEIFKVINLASKKIYQENVNFIRCLMILAKYKDLHEVCLFILSKMEIKKDFLYLDNKSVVSGDINILNECGQDINILDEFGQVIKLAMSRKTRIHLTKFCEKNLKSNLIDFISILLQKAMSNISDDGIFKRYLSTINDLSFIIFNHYNEIFKDHIEELTTRFNIEKKKIHYLDFVCLYEQNLFNMCQEVDFINCEIYELFDKITSDVTIDSAPLKMISLFGLYEGFVNFLILFSTTNKNNHIEVYKTKRKDLEKSIQKCASTINNLLRGNDNIVPFLSKFNVLSFTNKQKYLRNKIDDMEYYIDGPFSITVRRKSVLEDSFFQIMNKSAKELKTKRIQIKFSGEKGLDFGGLTKEWLELIIKEALNPDLGLFVYSSDKHTTVHPFINSNINSDHLLYFKFLGRILAKVIIEGYNLGIYFDKSVYKYLLSKKCDLSDLEEIDYQYYNSLIWIRDNPIDGILNLTFSFENNEFGACLIEDLIPNGKNISVNDQNKNEYIDLVVQRKLTKNVELQLNAIKEGLFELIDEDLISIFTENELELLICGIPEINVEDWQNNTIYNGYSKNSRNIVWFWRAVNGFTPDEKAKLLQFCTGSTRVPFDGFINLQGNSGTQKFSIHKVSSDSVRLPSAHTCFNQLDLPEYSTYDDLRRSVIYAINECNEGFEMI